MATDRIDGYDPAEAARKMGINLDAWENELTGINTSARDKLRAGEFHLDLISGMAAEARWRGSDLGARIVETIPDEMVREGWDIKIQPDDDDDPDDARGDALPMLPPAPPKRPGVLPEQDADSAAAIDELDDRLRSMDLVDRVREAMCCERAYGGGVVLIGADDGATNLADPLNEDAIKSIRHLTTFRGGWDGEAVAWSYYADPREPRYGTPEVYQVRNIGVPTVAIPAPGQPSTFQPPAPTVWYVHESRLLVFPGVSTSRWARVSMRGWGDSIFTRIDRILSQYDQTWSGVANLMSDFAQGVLKIEGLAAMMAADGTDEPAGSGTGNVAKRALAIQMSRSIARMVLLDANEEFSREATPLAGIHEILNQFTLRLAAAADMPVSLLMGQVQGGLGDAAAGDIRFFYDRVAARQRVRLTPQIRRLVRLMMLAKDSPTKGVPERWDVVARPLWQLSASEQATLRKTQADTDVAYVNAGVVTPEEIAASRFGGATYSTETVIDVQGRREMADLDERDKAEADAMKSVTPPIAPVDPNDPNALLAKDTPTASS